MTFRSILQSEWAPYGQMSKEQLDRIEQHFQLLTCWNRSLNLTRIRNIDEAVKLHYCESLYLGLVLPPGRLKIVDVGSGAGFPGLPVAIIRPECLVTLVESDRRKAVFLREAAANISNASVIEARAEKISERFDWIVSRAVAAKEVFKLQLAPWIALLTTCTELASLPTVSEMHPLPWGHQRAIGVFHVEHNEKPNRGQKPC